MIFIGDRIKYNLKTDKVIESINRPSFMTDRIREELRVNKDGYYYLHTDNDRENELIYTSAFDINGWMEINNVSVN